MRTGHLLTLFVAALVGGPGCGCGAADDEAAGGPREPVAASSAPQSLSSAAEDPPGARSAATAPAGEEPGEAAEEPTPQPAEPPAPTWQPRPDDPREAEHPIEDPSGVALAHFYDALARADDGEPGALVRVTHMGDSSIGMDQLPHYLRRPFQERFGDGGTGFVLLQPHSPSYRNQTVHLSTPTPWDFCFIIFRCLRDGAYGLGGVAASSRGGARSVIRTRREGDFGRTASHIELWYAGQPRGGTLELRVDHDSPIRIDTAADAVESRWYETDVEPGEHVVQVRAAGGGEVRGYGVVLETDGPGVVWDTLSMIGAFTPRLLEQDPEHFAEQLGHRRSDLVVLGYGGNDLRRYAGHAVTLEQLQDETRQLLERVKSARPEISCLLTGVTEHRMSGRAQVTSEDVQRVVDAQRTAAREAGCAFFDAYAAMGGAGSYTRWLRRGLAAQDGKHLSPGGRRILAGWMYEALVAGYVQHRTSSPADPQR